MPYFFSLLLLLLSTLAHAMPDIQRRATGDTACGNTMCVSATVNDSTTSYVLSSLGSTQVGWMAIGFGTQMADTPMVIMWMNSDGTTTLSQRKAASEVMPTVDSNPPRTASFSSALSVLSSSKPSLAFTIPSNSDTTQTLIYALGTTNPDSSSVSATLIQHYDYGAIQVDLTKALSSTGSTTGSTPTPGSGAVGIPIQPYQQMIIAHAIFCTFGFLLFLPAGALLARYLRTFIPGHIWFKGHAILQFFIAGPTIFIGVILGVAAVANAGAVHLDDDHKRWGIGIFVLYLLQCMLGAFIHYVKKKDRTRRPLQNYFHAVVGLLIIALALYQVRTGYDYEWPTETGLNPLPPTVDVVYWIWVILLPVAYGIGLIFIPKQYRLEKKAVRENLKRQYDTNAYNMNQRS
jgi:hypothetical protein